jgi:acetylglutamate synthase
MTSGDVRYETMGSFDELNTGKLTSLIEESLKKRLVMDYYKETVPAAIILARNGNRYIGAAIIQEITPELRYVDKFVVTPTYQGNGIGGTLLDLVELQCPKHNLRAKADNPHQKIYVKKGYLFEPSGEWVHYWKGLEGQELRAAMDYAMRKPKTVEVIK